MFIGSQMINAKWFAIFMAIVLTAATVLTLAHCSGEDGKAGQPPTHADGLPILHDVVVDSIYVPLPAETVRVATPVRVDTQRIIADYFDRHIYRDTLRASAPGKLGGSAEAIVCDTIAQNGIAGRSVRLTFTPNRLATARSVGLLSTWGMLGLTLMVEYRYRRWAMYAGYNFSEHSPVAGVGYRLIEW